MSQVPEQYPGDDQFDPQDRTMSYARKLMLDNQLWRDIRDEAKENPALQEALDRAILIYHLSKSNGQK